MSEAVRGVEVGALEIINIMVTMVRWARSSAGVEMIETGTGLRSAPIRSTIARRRKKRIAEGSATRRKIRRTTRRRRIIRKETVKIASAVAVALPLRAAVATGERGTGT
jgi:hypothetical protein